MEAVYAPVFDLFQVLVGLGCGQETAGTVHDYAIQVLVQGQDFEKRIMEYRIVFGDTHGFDSQNAKITRMDQHEPAMAKRLDATMTGRFACVLARVCAFDVDFLMSISHKLFDCTLAVRWKDLEMEVLMVCAKSLRCDLVADLDAEM